MPIAFQVGYFITVETITVKYMLGLLINTMLQYKREEGDMEPNRKLF